MSTLFSDEYGDFEIIGKVERGGRYDDPLPWKVVLNTKVDWDSFEDFEGAKKFLGESFLCPVF